MQFCFFGLVRATFNDQPLQFRSNKVRALLALIWLDPRRQWARDQLASLLWEDYSSSKARTNLRVTFSQLQHSLHPLYQAFPERAPLLIADRARIVLQAQTWPELQVDVWRFDQAIAAYHAHNHEHGVICVTCLEQLTGAVGLYQGDLLTPFAIEASSGFDAWLERQREARHRQLILAYDVLADSALRMRDFHEVQRLSTAQLVHLPWHEQAHRRLMISFAELGHQSLLREQYLLCQRTLERELGIGPDPETQALYQRLINASATSPLPNPTLQTLPELSKALIGRTHELALLHSLIEQKQQRLVTLLGLGGIGKTTLALAYAHAAQAAFEAVWFVSFVGSAGESLASDHHRISATIATTLGLSQQLHTPQAALLHYLGQRSVLLVLDNLEHLVHEAMDLQAILDVCPHVVLLVTSREPLNIQAEQRLQLHGLALANADQTFATSAQLFLARGTNATRQMLADPASLEWIDRICRMLDGNPLAIELAARWVHYLGLDEIATAIEQDMDFLQTSVRDLPDRHRSMRAVFDGSWRLLSRHEQRVLSQASLLRGSWSLAAMRSIIGVAHLTVRDLIDKSWLAQDAGRYSMHRLIQQYAAEQLQPMPTTAMTTTKRHSVYYLALVRRHTLALSGSQPQASIRLLRDDLDNIRQAWLWALEHGATHLVHASLAGLSQLYDLMGLYHEAIRVLQTSISQIQRQPTSLQQQRLLMRLTIALASHFNAAADYRTAEQVGQQALDLAQTLDLPQYIAACLLQIGIAQRNYGQFAAAEQSLQRSIAIAQTLPLKQVYAHALRSLGFLAYLQGNYAMALRYHEQALAFYRLLHDQRSINLAQNTLALIALAQGDPQHAWDQLAAILTRCQVLEDGWGEALTLNNLGAVVQAQGDPVRAIDYYQKALSIRQRIGDRWGEGISLSNLAAAWHEQADYQTAYQITIQAIQHTTAIHDLPTKAYALATLSQILRALGDQTGAAAAQSEAVTLRTQLGQTHLLAETID
ncbi:tetratricopeptide repeat protein [Herpetosiphon gulosus]|uniref:Bacterial transcriptional activator domain-containing protein n=1 Tax=Herpetosiphon gulosus TaxID=1973496 RepID=A0ABP9X0L4_9CHLR